jgi:hypothetical protein
MTAFQLVLLNGILLSGCILLAYLMSHGDKGKKTKRGSLKHDN